MDELLDENIRDTENYRVPYKLDYVKGPFKGWKITFFLSIALGVIGSLVLLYMEFIWYPNSRGGDTNWETYQMFQQIATVLYIAGGISFILNMVFQLIVLYRHWSVIKDVSDPSATPGTAVGFVFIPIFNLYWVFIAFYKLSVDQERFIKQFGVSIPKKPQPGLALAAVICRLIPYLGILTYFILGPMRIYNQQRVSEGIINQIGE